MEIQSAEQLCQKRCHPCEGGVPRLTADEATRQLQSLGGWELSADGQRIRKQWTMKNFLAAMRFFDLVARVSEEQGHHPDLHLERYRHVTIELWTHAIGGLSENDFICAALIDQLPVEVRAQK